MTTEEPHILKLLAPNLPQAQLGPQGLALCAIAGVQQFGMDRLAPGRQVDIGDDVTAVGPTGGLVNISRLAADTVGPGKQDFSLRAVLPHPMHAGGQECAFTVVGAVVAQAQPGKFPIVACVQRGK